jgi:hypothetical protein
MGCFMVWAWSHSVEGCEAVRGRIFAIAECAQGGDRESMEWLGVVFAEWCGVIPGGNWSHDYSDRGYLRGLRRAYSLGRRLGWAEVAQEIWDKCESQALCENGGHHAWACPFGCGCHLLSFNPVGWESV